MLQRTPPRDNVRGQSKVAELSMRSPAGTEVHRGPRSSPQKEQIEKMRSKEAEQLQKYRTVIGSMKDAISRQRNISMDVKTGLKELEEPIDVIAHCRSS